MTQPNDTTPVVNAVKSWMSERVYKAAQEGAKEGLARFAAQLTAATGLPSPGAAPLPIPMPSAAQVTTADQDGGEVEGHDDADETPSPAINVPLFERPKELVENGLSQREAARRLNIPESTARRWLRAAAA